MKLSREQANMLNRQNMVAKLLGKTNPKSEPKEQTEKMKEGRIHE